MTRLLLIILLFLSSSPVYAEWAAVDRTDGGEITAFADPDTIRRVIMVLCRSVLHTDPARWYTLTRG